LAVVRIDVVTYPFVFAPIALLMFPPMKAICMALSDDQIAKTKRPRLVIPAGTYSGVDSDVATTSLPVVAHTTTAMDAATAYTLTKTYWEEKTQLGQSAAWWDGVDPKMLETVHGKLHDGALKYYDEIGVSVPDHLR